MKLKKCAIELQLLNKGNLIKLDTTENLLDSIKTKKIIFKVEKIKIINSKDLNGIKFSYNSNNEIIVYMKEKNTK